MPVHRILLNSQVATLGQSATGRYVRALVRHLPDSVANAELTYFDYLWRRRPYTWSLPPSRARNLLWPCPPRAGEWAFRRLAWSDHLVGRYDLMHLPDDTNLRSRARKVVSTLHMAPPLQRPDFFEASYNEYVRKWLRRARDTQDMLITVSEHSRQLVTSEYGFVPDRVKAIPLGVDECFMPAAQPWSGPPRILFVGWIRPAKNVRAVCQVFCRLLDRIPDLELVLVGKMEVDQQVFHSWLDNRPQAIARVRLAGQVALGDGVGAYHTSSVLLFPSYAEGWTSPPLEAMRCGLPVVCSDVSSLPETVGDAALMAGPDDHDALAEAVYRVLTDSALRLEMVERGFRHSERYTWSRMVQETAALYSHLLEAGQ